MKKQTFFKLLMGIIGGLLFSLGICMCLISEWNTFIYGVISASIGAVIFLVPIVVAIIESDKSFKFNFKLFGKILFGIGMCMVLVWDMMLGGIVVGTIGIILLICLIPICTGFKA